MAKNKITIIGAGNWGSALGNLMAENNHQVIFFSKDNKPVLRKSAKISVATSFCDDFEKAFQGSKFIFIVTPSSAVKEILKKLAAKKISEEVILVICSKGIDDENSKLFSEIISEILPKNNFAILSGPNFASEVTAKLPTTTTIASQDKSIADKIIKLLKNDYFLPIYSDDLITTQICGAVKNILAIGCGIIEGLKLGENAKAALIIKGISEINLLSEKLGGKAENLFSPAGFGDLFLTCSSKKSRNNSLGILIGKGQNPQKILKTQTKTYEGARAAKSIATLAKNHKIKLPLCNAIHDILYKNSKVDITKTIHQSIFSK